MAHHEGDLAAGRPMWARGIEWPDFAILIREASGKDAGKGKGVHLGKGTGKDKGVHLSKGKGKGKDTSVHLSKGKDTGNLGTAYDRAYDARLAELAGLF